MKVEHDKGRQVVEPGNCAAFHTQSWRVTPEGEIDHRWSIIGTKKSAASLR